MGSNPTGGSSRCSRLQGLHAKPKRRLQRHCQTDLPQFQYKPMRKKTTHKRQCMQMLLRTWTGHMRTNHVFILHLSYLCKFVRRQFWCKHHRCNSNIFNCCSLRLKQRHGLVRGKAKNDCAKKNCSVAFVGGTRTCRNKRQTTINIARLIDMVGCFHPFSH